MAASLVAPATFAAPPEAPPPEQVAVIRPTLDVVFVLDTTGSMGGLIEGAKQKIWSIASRMASGTPTPRIRVGLVAYRDQGDSYVTKRFDLTEDLDAVFANLKSLTADGGGDGPEHVGRGLGEAVSLMTWSKENKTAKTIFLVGDAPAHDDYQDGWNTTKWTKKAISQGIVVNTIRCGDDHATGTLFTSLAKMADGTFVSIGQTGGMVAVATPFDAEMSTLTKEIADRTMVGGTREGQRAAERALGDLKSMDSATNADRVAFKGKSAPSASIAAVPVAPGAVSLNAEPAKVNSLAESDLPAAVRAVPKPEREAFVRRQNEEQQALQTKLNTLAQKRETYLKTQAAKPDSFDEKVFEGVKKSAARAGVAY
jgi:Mg-chelatase subunit ChlD